MNGGRIAGHGKQQAANDSIAITASALSLADGSDENAHAEPHPAPSTPEDSGRQAAASPAEAASAVAATTISAQAGLLKLQPGSDPSRSPSEHCMVAGPEDQAHAPSGARLKSRNSRRAQKRASKPSGRDQGPAECIVCWCKASSIIFLPCGHICCCCLCAQPMLTGGVPCPMCRGAVESGIAVGSLD